MECEICHLDHRGDTWVSLPVVGNDGGYKNALACPACAHKAATYCLGHGQPHTILKNGNTICPLCLEEKVNKKIFVINQTTSDWVKALSLSEKKYLNDFLDKKDTFVNLALLFYFLKFYPETKKWMETGG